MAELFRAEHLRRLLLAAFFALAGAAGQAATPAVEAPAVGELRLEMDPVDAEALFRKDPYDTSRFAARVVDGERRLEGKIAVKGSFSRHFLKKSLLLTLPAGQAWQGRRRLALNAMATDPTQAREWLAWDLIRRLGTIGPQVEFRRLYVNGAYIGLYLDIEWMDEAMFARLGLDQGSFFQPNDEGFCGDLTPASLTQAEFCWSRLFPREADLSPLRALIAEIDTTPAERFDAFLDQRFDAQSVIDWLLINLLTQDGDTYNKNYFLHLSKDGRWRVIPWDYDLSWGRVADVALPFPRMIYNDFFQYTYPPDLGAQNPLKDKALANPRLYARLLARLREVLGETETASEFNAWYRPDRFQRRLGEIGALVRASLAQEKYPPADAARHDREIEALAFFNEWRYHLLRNQLLLPNAFDRLRWLPNTAYPPLTPVTEESRLRRLVQPLNLAGTVRFAAAGERRFFIEDLLGWPVAAIRLRAGSVPVRVTVETEREQQPPFLPPDQAAPACVERSWVVTAKSSSVLEVDLELDYLQESSLRHELGAEIHDEARLALWQFDGQTWQALPTRANPLANRLVAEGVRLSPHLAHRFVACEAPATTNARP